MVGVDADGYGHSLARTYTLTTHTQHKHPQFAAPWWGLKYGPTQKKGTHNPHVILTTHSYTVWMSLGVCSPVRLFETKLSSHLCLKSEMGLQHSNIAKYEGRGHRPGAISRGE